MGGGRSIIRAEILISSDGLAAHLNRRVDVSGTMSRLPGVTSSAAHHAYVQIWTRYGGRRGCMWRGGWTSGNDETDLSRSGGASSSVECKPGSQNASPLSGPRARRWALIGFGLCSSGGDVREKRCWEAETDDYSFNLIIGKDKKTETLDNNHH